MATATVEKPQVSHYEEQVAKRKPAYTLRRSRMEIRFASEEAMFPIRKRDMQEVRKFEEDQARKQNLDPFYLWASTPAPGLAWCESKPMHIGKIFTDLADAGLVLIDVYSHIREQKKMIKGQEVVIKVFRNVLVYQLNAELNLEAAALAESVITDIGKAGFQFGSVFINRNQHPATGQWWRGDSIELSAPTSRPRTTPSLRINRNTYALEESDLPPKEVKRKERTFDEWVGLAVSFAQKHGTPVLTLQEWRGSEVRMAAAVKLGFDPEDYRFTEADNESK